METAKNRFIVNALFKNWQAEACLEWEHPHQDAPEDEGTADGIADDALAIDLELQLSDLIGADNICGAEIGGPDYTPHRYHLAFGIDDNFFAGFHYQIAVREDVRNARTESGAQLSGPGGSALAVELGLGIQAGQVGQGSGGLGDATSRGDGTFQAGLALGFGGALDDRGSLVGHQNRDKVVDLAGAEVAGKAGISRCGRPKGSGGCFRRILLATYGVVNVLIERAGLGNLLLFAPGDCQGREGRDQDKRVI